MKTLHSAPLGPSKRSGTILKETRRILRAPGAPRSASERSPALQGAPSRPPRPSRLPKSFSNAFRVRHARPGARRSAPRRSKAGQTGLRGLQGFQEAFPTRLECAMRAPERVRALPGAPSAPRRSKARQACFRGLQGFQKPFPTRLECAMRAPERVGALPGVPRRAKQASAAFRASKKLFQRV